MTADEQIEVLGRAVEAGMFDDFFAPTRTSFSDVSNEKGASFSDVKLADRVEGLLGEPLRVGTKYLLPSGTSRKLSGVVQRTLLSRALDAAYPWPWPWPEKSHG